MARNFSSREYEALFRRHSQLLAELDAAAAGMAEDTLSIKLAVQRMTEREVQKILQEIPVEEINRDKKGIRTKVLRDSGYETLLDLSCASVQALTDLNGISEEGAYGIKQSLSEITDQARKGIRLRLSADDKNPGSSALVQAVCRYQQRVPNAKLCKSLIRKEKAAVSSALLDLEPGKKGLGWLFLSRSVKERAEAAYTFLNGQFAPGKSGALAEEAVNALKALSKITPEDGWNAFSQDPIPFWNALEALVPGVFGGTAGDYGLPKDLALQVQQEPLYLDGLHCTLRRYQEWGVKFALHQKRVLLGDEMGLGKTVQAIAVMVSLHHQGATHFIVVCPASVLTNWCREIQKHSGLSVVKVHGDRRDSAWEAWQTSGGVAVTTYETTGHLPLPEAARYTLMVVDEAHYIKNPGAQRSRNVKALSRHAERLLFMTGTALENRVEEMISLISLLNPEIAQGVRGMEALASAPQFQERVAPVYFRRKRSDVLTELPELIETREWCDLLPKEQKLYEAAVLDGSFADVRRVSFQVPDLRDSSKAQRLLEIIEEAKAENRKLLVFSFFLDTIRKISALLGPACTEPITGSISPQHRQEIVDAFDKAPAGTVLVSQIQSGGTGLNIQSASVVVLCEPQLKPSIENQAISRAYRMGQTRNVLVYRLLCDDTADEEITRLLEEKQAIFDAFADESLAAQQSQQLDAKAMGTILEKERARITGKQGHSEQSPGPEPM